jgi:ATP-dependent Lon protease
LPLRDVVVFPHMVIPLFVGRPKSIKALETAMEAGKSILLVAQKSAAKDEPKPRICTSIGCVANILQMLKLPDGTVKVLVEGVQRARIERSMTRRRNVRRRARRLPVEETASTRVEALRRAVIAQFDQYVKLNKKIPPEILTSLDCRHRGSRSSGRHHRRAPAAQARAEAGSPRDVRRPRAHRALLTQLETEIDILQVEKAHPWPRQAPDGEEPARVLPERAGQGDPEGTRRRRGGCRSRGDGEEDQGCRHEQGSPGQGQSELKKLKLMSPMSAEATVVRNYIETLIGLPWRKKTRISKDLAEPRRCSTRITTAWRRSRNASSSISPCSSASTS